MCRRRILFSDRFDWETPIRKKVQLKYRADFQNISQVQNLDKWEMIIPLKIQDIEFLSTEFSYLNGKKFLIPSREALSVANDKALFHSFMTENGFGEYIPKQGDSLKPPYLLKKKVTEYGDFSRVILSSDMEISYDSGEFFKQECIFGNRELSTHVLAKDGKIVFHTSREFVCPDDVFVKGGNYHAEKRNLIQKKEIETPHLGIFQSIVQKLNFSGFACFDYKIKDGIPKIFEMNPRYGASLTASLQRAMVAYEEALGLRGSGNNMRMKILFGNRKDWEPQMRDVLSARYSVTFTDIFSLNNLDRWDMVIPLLLEEISFLNTTFPHLNGKKFCIPTKEQVKLFDDKLLFSKFMDATGHGEFVPKMGEGINFPYVLKKRVDEFGVNTKIIHDEQEEEPYSREEFFKQESVSGNTEFTTHFLAQKGKMVFHHTCEFVCDDPLFIRGKNYIPAKINYSVPTPFVDIFERIIRDVNFSGFGCFNYKIKDGIPKIFEMNPRYGASLVPSTPSAIRAYIKVLGKKQRILFFFYDRIFRIWNFFQGNK